MHTIVQIAIGGLNQNAQTQIVNFVVLDQINQNKENQNERLYDLQILGKRKRTG